MEQEGGGMTELSTTVQNSSDEELKPCPFCGSTKIYVYVPTMYEIGNDASVNCENPLCGAEVRGESSKEAIAKWNRRVGE